MRPSLRLDTAVNNDRRPVDARLLVPATLSRNLGRYHLTDTHLDRVNLRNKPLTLVVSALAQGDRIDASQSVQAEGTGPALAFGTMAAHR